MRLTLDVLVLVALQSPTESIHSRNTQGEKGEGGGSKSKSAAAVKGDFGIEWQIQFVKAEQLIQKHLNHPKLRCLLFALLMNKVFVGENVIASEHIREVSL